MDKEKQAAAPKTAADMRREYQQAWRDKNREHVREYARAWKKEHKDAQDRYWQRKADRYNREHGLGE